MRIILILMHLIMSSLFLIWISLECQQHLVKVAIYLKGYFILAIDIRTISMVASYLRENIFSRSSNLLGRIFSLKPFFELYLAFLYVYYLFQMTSAIMRGADCSTLTTVSVSWLVINLLLTIILCCFFCCVCLAVVLFHGMAIADVNHQRISRK